MNLMPEEVGNVNSRGSIHYLSRRYPKINVQRDIVDELNKEYGFLVRNPITAKYEPLSAVHLTDTSIWMSNFCYDRFYAKMVEKTDNPGLGYGMGRESLLDREVLSFIGPIISVEGLLEQMPAIMEKWNYTKKGIVIENKPGHFIFRIEHKPGVLVSDVALDYHLGLFDECAWMCGLVGFETLLRSSDRERNNFEFEGNYEYRNLAARMINQYLIKNLPTVRRSLEVSRQNTIKHREASARERHLKEKALKERESMRKFIPPTVLHDMDIGKDPKRGLVNEYLSILFTDIRGFTKLSEGINNEMLGYLLDDYFEPIVKPIAEHGGWVDKFIGDAVMAQFGSEERQHPAYDAVSCGIDMRTALAQFNESLSSNQRYAENGVKSLRAGIGISTGNVRRGNIGSTNRMDNSVIGDKVNTAQRLEGLTKQYGIPIIVDETTYKDIQKMGMLADYSGKSKEALESMLADGKIFAREIDFVRVEGKKEVLRIYEIMNPFHITTLSIRAVNDRLYSEALKLSHFNSSNLKEIQKALEKSTEIFEAINKSYKNIKHGISENFGDPICRRKIKENETFLEKIHSAPEFFSNQKWFVRSFDK